MDILFDIVIPVGPNDSNVINNMIEYTKKNIIGYRNIYLISYDPTIVINDCITINEDVFHFTKKNIIDTLGNNDRVGWYLQQLIKLYASYVINGILNNYLVIDSDTYFLKPTSFFNNKLPLYNIGTEYHRPYFEHMNKLHSTLVKQNNNSGICHHMMFQKHILNELFSLIEHLHKLPFWKVFLLSISKKDITGSGASEYELYFNYLHIYHQNKFSIRPLKWENTNNLNNLNNGNNLDYVSCHWYLR